jgi:CHAT domain-containing protein
MNPRGRRNIRDRGRLALILFWICLLSPWIMPAQGRPAEESGYSTRVNGATENVESFTESPQTVVLNYIWSSGGIRLLLIHPRTDGSPATSRTVEMRLSLTAMNELTTSLTTFHRQVAERDPLYRVLGRNLYDILIGPVADDLRGWEQLCLVPAGLLWEVPFQALITPEGRHLIEIFAIHYAPSVKMPGELTRRRERRERRGALLALGNPTPNRQQLTKLRARKREVDLAPLPEAELEVQIISQLHGIDQSQILIGSAASESAFKRLVGDHEVLHFATHGILDNADPLKSCLLLANPEPDSGEDGLLEAREIMQLDLAADLAILSACETARGRVGAGDGVSGMSRAFLSAGCQTLIVSQWKVDSRRTAELIVSFFKFLKTRTDAQPPGKSKALQLAARRLMQNSSTRHPFYWAGMIMIGRNQ